MPACKSALKRLRIIDRMLSDPNYTYTTREITLEVNRECDDNETVTERQIQKDIKSLEDKFGLELDRPRKGRVRYKDQSEPLFFQELTMEEERLMKEVLNTLGQFDGLDRFPWIDNLKKKLNLNDCGERPVMSFMGNDNLLMPETLLGRLYTAISDRTPIRIGYRKFTDSKEQRLAIYPYQLRQYNGRWYLLCNYIGVDAHPFNPDRLDTLPLDRISADFDILSGVDFIDTPIDLSERFDEIVGVTYLDNVELEEVVFAVKPFFVPYIETKRIHVNQVPLEPELQDKYRKKYPSLSDCKFYVMDCRPNNEFFNLFCSYSGRIILVEGEHLRKELRNRMRSAADEIDSLGKA